jgi:hypothetical protein
MMVKNKRILKEIAKRFAKAVLKDSSDCAFMDTGLSIEEEMYIGKQLLLIGEKITELPIINCTEDLVNEYYD